MIWKEITGYAHRYRINENGDVEKMNASGSWAKKTVFRVKGRNKIPGRAMVHMTTAHRTYKHVAVVNLMLQAFGLERPEGMVVAHKNGSIMDCSLENLYFATAHDVGKRYGGSRRMSVEKYDTRTGEVVELYSSESAAAAANFLNVSCVSRRCHGKTKAELPGHISFRFEYEER